jgi:diketogulonate reductase-like aldo/keto reductase
MLNFRQDALCRGALSWKCIDVPAFIRRFDAQCVKVSTRVAEMTAQHDQSSQVYSDAPEIYRDVLRRLRLLRRSGMWPKSSKGRALLIQNRKREEKKKKKPMKKGNEKEKEKNDVPKSKAEGPEDDGDDDDDTETTPVSKDDTDLGGGTFTVGCMPYGAESGIDDDANDDGSSASASSSSSSSKNSLREPKSNSLFPDLMKAIFELERAIMPGRPPSACCAVNCCARFMPHKDSGAGNGQQISCIVALGDFSGGALAVEGEIKQVRYQPLEFDGWAQRHWTLPFAGERFSLVWFSPLGCGPEDTGLSLCSGATPRSSASSTLARLRNGVAMPRIGLGTFRLRGDECEAAVKIAVGRCGYRLIDTAEVYKNAVQVRLGIAAAMSETTMLQRPRDGVFLVSKLSPRAMVAPFGSRVRASFLTHCAALGRQTLDLYLMHWVAPHGMGPADSGGDGDTSAAESRAACWLEMEKLYFEGRIRAIGVSNFTVAHLERLIADPRTTVVPHVNQVEAHPLYPQKVLRCFCRDRGIIVTAYASLGQGQAALLGREEVGRAAAAMRGGCTRAQALLAWGLSKGMSVIPKSSSGEARLKENMTAARWLEAAAAGQEQVAATVAFGEGMRILDGMLGEVGVGGEATAHAQEEKDKKEVKFAWDSSAFC